MSLIKCDECGKEFSDKANACPNCACPVERKKENIKEYTELSNEEKKRLKEYMRKKGILYPPVDYILSLIMFVFAMLGMFWVWWFMIIAFMTMVLTLSIQANRKREYYYEHPESIEK